MIATNSRKVPLTAACYAMLGHGCYSTDAKFTVLYPRNVMARLTQAQINEAVGKEFASYNSNSNDEQEDDASDTSSTDNDEDNDVAALDLDGELQDILREGEDADKCEEKDPEPHAEVVFDKQLKMHKVGVVENYENRHRDLKPLCLVEFSMTIAETSKNGNAAADGDELEIDSDIEILDFDGDADADELEIEEDAAAADDCDEDDVAPPQQQQQQQEKKQPNKNSKKEGAGGRVQNMRFPLHASHPPQRQTRTPGQRWPIRNCATPPDRQTRTPCPSCARCTAPPPEIHRHSVHRPPLPAAHPYANSPGRCAAWRSGDSSIQWAWGGFNTLTLCTITHSLVAFGKRR